MCGIAGILLAPHAADPRALAAVGAMAASLHHRGPDGGGVWLDREAGIALGHRRLAIVDLSEAGRQPMLSHGGNLVATYNGEIYNFAALRPELEALGHCFRGHSDTEVMLAAFESFGIEPALRRFAGMFAIGLWDRASRMLHLIRDRLGKKPLYVAAIKDGLIFASELKALLAFPGFQPEIDRTALAMVLRRGYVPEGHCIWRGVLKVPPGAMLSVRADDLQASSAELLRECVRPYWSLAEAAQAGQHNLLDPAEGEDALDELLRLAVRERMVADVPLGAFLSGGIDSATVVALMQAQSSRPVRTFTIGFDDARWDEADAAARIAQHLGTEHTELRLTPSEARAVIPDLPRIWDEPFADELQIPTFLVSRMARQHVTVALSGDGGDEAFGGYTRHFTAARLQNLLGLPAPLRRAASGALQLLGPEALDGLHRALPLPESLRNAMRGANLQKLARVLDARDERDLYERLTMLVANSAMPGPAVEQADTVPALSDIASRMMFRDMAGYLPGDILVKLDRASMAVSLETRCPLLDHRVIELAWRLPSAVKVQNGTGKWRAAAGAWPLRPRVVVQSAEARLQRADRGMAARRAASLGGRAARRDQAASPGFPRRGARTGALARASERRARPGL